MFPASPKPLSCGNEESFEHPGGEDAEFFVFKTKAASAVPLDTSLSVVKSTDTSMGKAGSNPAGRVRIFPGKIVAASVVKRSVTSHSGGRGFDPRQVHASALVAQWESAEPQSRKAARRLRFRLFPGSARQFGGGEEIAFFGKAFGQPPRRLRKEGSRCRSFPVKASLAVVKKTSASVRAPRESAEVARSSCARATCSSVSRKGPRIRSFPAIPGQPVVKMSATSWKERGHRSVPRLALGSTKFGGRDRHPRSIGGEEVRYIDC